MSLKTWKIEYYPITARACPKKDALEHSLLKWRGLRPDALARHGLVLKDLGLIEARLPVRRTDFYIASDTCALCEWHASDRHPNDCRTCPLYVNSKLCCDPGRGYAKFDETGDVEPMIKELEEAIARRAK